MRNIVGVCLLLAATAVSASAAQALAPEPGTIALLGGGLATFGLLAWRKRRK